MIKYVPEDMSVCFAEIPDEICLCFNLSMCPHRCPGCHSKYLQTDVGNELTADILDSLIKKNQGITCVLFLGGDNDKETIKSFAKYIATKYGLLVGWYSGESIISLSDYIGYFDYIKVGPYIEHLGPLNSETTNQRIYHLYKSGLIEDITYRFWSV